MASPKPTIAQIQPYKPGKADTGEAGRAIKLSSNENPLGPSPKAIEAFQAAAASLHRYPDGSHAALRKAIGQVHGIDPARIICGAGSDELIGLLIQAYTMPGDEVLYSEHGFLMYKIYALSQGAVPKTAPEKDKRTDIQALIAAAGEKTKLCFVANPNNPTGSYITKDELKRLRDKLPKHVILVLDDAYSEYVEEEDYSDGKEMAMNLPNVVMLRTFSKLYGLPALRLGWGVASAEIIDTLNRIRGPFNLNSAALAAGIAAVKDTGYAAHSRNHNNRELKRVSEGLEALGLHCYPSVGNFLLVEFGSAMKAEAANTFLLKQGIIVRAVAAYGLASCLRISIGTSEENAELLIAMRSFTADKAA